MLQQTDSILPTSGSENISTESTYVTRQDIMNFPFPYKLWLAVHLDFCDFLRWNRDGTVLLLDLVALEDYLNSTRSIFKIKNCSIFLQHLEQFKFERLNATPEAEEDLLMQYKNDNFQRHRLDLLAKIRRHTYQMLGEIDQEQAQNAATMSTSENQLVAQTQTRVAQRMLGDLCFMSHGGLSNIQKSRLRFQTILNFEHETRILQQKLRASDERAANVAALAQQRRLKSDVLGRAAGVNVAEEEQVIELPVEMFENPHDSVLHFEDFRPEYAGYYGNSSKEQISHFFGDYLPMYEDGSMEVRKITAVDNSSSANRNTYNSNDIQQVQANDELGKFAATTVDKISTMSPLNLSSALEPIFKADEEEEIGENDVEAQTKMEIHQENETEITMEEFITFKNNNRNELQRHKKLTAGRDDGTTDSSPITVEDVASNAFPQMPAAVKMELTDEVDTENEANFRNFFSQYRASLNLLYERH